MSNYELDAILEYTNELEKEEWERLRMQCFYSVVPHTTDRKLTPEKVMPFYWDNINKKAGTKIDIDNDKNKNRIDELLKKTE